MAFILSSNVNRRHINVGQRAMAVAMVYPEPKPGERTDLRGTPSKNEGVKSAYLSYARTVLRYAPDLADGVLAGGSLNQAYAIAHENKERAEWEHGRRAWLHARYPDLAKRVKSGTAALLRG